MNAPARIPASAAAVPPAAPTEQATVLALAVKTFLHALDAGILDVGPEAFRIGPASDRVETAYLGNVRGALSEFSAAVAERAHLAATHRRGRDAVSELYGAH